MKILFMNWKSFGNEDILDAFTHLADDGEKADVVLFPFENTADRNNPEIEQRLEEGIKKECPDFVFSFNYYPIISKVCNEMGVKYVSWVYDSPHIALYSFTVINKCNYIFVFDSAMYEEFAAQGINTVHYLPLAVSTRRLDKLKPSQDQISKYRSDISFVGQLYTEEHNFYDRCEQKIDDFTKGYLEGVMSAQQQVYGANFVKECLTPEIMKALMEKFPMEPNADGVETSEYMYANYMLDRKITSNERKNLISSIGQKHEIKLFTPDRTFTPKGIRNMGKIDYYNDMPYVFKCSKINLNITLRSITKGIPLRCFDIMGSGKMLLTNYQEDMFRFFTPGEDYCLYESKEDLLSKIEYYLLHEDERMKIEESAHEKMQNDHSYDVRVRQMLEIVCK